MSVKLWFAPTRFDFVVVVGGGSNPISSSES